MFDRLLRRVLFPTHLIPTPPDAGSGIANLDRVWVESDEGRVEGWFLPARGAVSQPRPTIVFAHGNGELIDFWPQPLERYRTEGFNLFLPEYRGYGRSHGSPSQEAITMDFVSFRDALVRRDDVDAERLVYHGRSLGGGAVCALADLHAPAALILESTFTSVADMAGAFGVPRAFVSDPFDNLGTVSRLKTTPILIVHGNRDEVVPFSHARRLADAAPHATFHTMACGHNDGPDDPRRYWEILLEFLGRSVSE